MRRDEIDTSREKNNKTPDAGFKNAVSGDKQE